MSNLANNFRPKSSSSALAVLCNNNGKHYIFEDSKVKNRRATQIVLELKNNTDKFVLMSTPDVPGLSKAIRRAARKFKIRTAFKTQNTLRLVNLSRRSPVRRDTTTRNKVVIGRSPTAFLCITESYISRKHCIIEKTEDNEFTICDMSNSGTFINDKRLIKNKPQKLNHLDRIKLGDKDAHAYIFLVNNKLFGVKNPQRVKTGSPLIKKMIDLNETQSLEKESMDKELNIVESERLRLKEELQEKLKAREDELERERFKVSMESAYNKEQTKNAEIKLKETMEENEQVMKEYERKIADFTKKEEELQKTKNEMGKRHQIEREELESNFKAEIEELKKKLEKSELQNQQFEESQNRLEEMKNVLLESELEQQRLFEAKVEAETKLESKILDLTNDRETKAEQLKELEMKLKEKEELEEKVKKEIEGLEDDMMCSICAELYIEPTALNCGHMFCKLCITEWSKKKKICPMCRAKILTTVRIFNMDSVIQRNIRLMSEEAHSRREALIAERKKGSTPQKKRSAKKRRREVPNFREPSPEPIAAYRLRTERESHEHPRVMHRIRPFVPSSSVEAPHESEGDPFEMGWVRNQQIRSVVTGRNSPVTIAAVDLTNVPMMDTLPGGRARTHTVTSADANTTIDLTDL